MTLSNTHASVVEQLIILADRLFPGEVRFILLSFYMLLLLAYIVMLLFCYIIIIIYCYVIMLLYYYYCHIICATRFSEIIGFSVSLATRSITLLPIPRQRPYLTASVRILFLAVEVLNCSVSSPTRFFKLFFSFLSRLKQTRPFPKRVKKLTGEWEAVKVWSNCDPVQTVFLTSKSSSFLYDTHFPIDLIIKQRSMVGIRFIRFYDTFQVISSFER